MAGVLSRHQSKRKQPLFTRNVDAIPLSFFVRHSLLSGYRQKLNMDLVCIPMDASRHGKPCLIRTIHPHLHHPPRRLWVSPQSSFSIIKRELAICWYWLVGQWSCLFYSHSKIGTTQRTSALAQQPRSNTLQVKSMTTVTRQLDDERVRVVEVFLGADGTRGLGIRL